MSELSLENVLIQVRDCLNANKIKLWEEPYCVANEAVEQEMQTLANLFSHQLNIRFDSCLAALNELQNHSLDKLASMEAFNQTGLATLKVRIPLKQIGSGGTKLITIEIKLSDNVSMLQQLIGEKLLIAKEKIKLISSGQVLDPESSLVDQNVKNFQQILALILETTETDALTESNSYDRIKKIRSEAELLLNNKQSDFFHLEDQAGNAIHVPDNEKKSLTLALLLHEKGRTQLKTENYNEALLLFLEADHELSICNSNLVQMIDNYAILNLDIVWCYMCLKSIMQLPDAERRLKICEEGFKRSYGENFSRLEKLKGSTENEKALIMRLHLLQGVLCFHLNRRNESISMLSVAERELNALKVDESMLNILIEMGYKRAEAITGLRSSYNNVEGAVTFILERKNKLKDARHVGKKERELENFLAHSGIEGFINPRSLHSLVEMGFPKALVALALKKTENNIAQSIELLQDHQTELKAELAKIIKPDKDFIDKLINLGFDAELAKTILKNTSNDLDSAIEALLDLQNVDNIPAQLLSLIDEAIPSTSGASNSSQGSSLVDKIKKKVKMTMEEQEAYEMLKEDLEMEDDDYLNTTLKQEEQLLIQYKNILSK
ncbi:unnamed protein product [Diamesa serratosioi]